MTKVNQGILTKSNVVQSRKIDYISLMLGGGLVALGFTAYLSIAANKSEGNNTSVKAKIQAAFPNTKFERVEYNDDLKLYEAEAGETIIYMTGPRFAIAGNIIDLKDNVDVTAQRRNELKAVVAAKNKLLGIEPEAKEVVRPQPRGPVGENAPIAEIQSINVDLKPDNYVVHNAGGGEVVYVVSDYNCPHCRNLFNAMAGMDYEVREIPVGFLGQNSALKGAEVLCSEDKAAAVSDVYYKDRNESVSTCSEGEALMAENTRWASENNVRSTPTIITSDGRVKSGGGPREAIDEFIKGSS